MIRPERTITDPMPIGIRKCACQATRPTFKCTVSDATRNSGSQFSVSTSVSNFSIPLHPLSNSVRIPYGLDGVNDDEANEGSTSLYLEVEFGLYDHFQSVDVASLCQMDGVESVNENNNGRNKNDDDNGGYSYNVCPSPGLYKLTTYYTVPSISDYNFHYTPDVRLTFTNARNAMVGCVTTGPVALHHTAAVKAVQGWIALGVAVLLFVLIFSILLVLSHRRKKLLERLRNHKRNPVSNYQYFRTLPNGQVVALPGGAQQPQPHPQPFMQSEEPDSEEEDDDEDDQQDCSNNALNISNPAYNETQIPTRPII